MSEKDLTTAAFLTCSNPRTRQRKGVSAVITRSNSSKSTARKTQWIVLAAAGIVSMMTVPEVSIAQVLPTNAAPTCLASSPTIPFSAWFSGGNPAVLNAAVTPANSITFTNNPALANTDFYQWSYRMFLWLTSPSPATYGGTGLVMSSPEFYNLSPPDSSGLQTLLQNPSPPAVGDPPPISGPVTAPPPPEPIGLALRVANLGPHNLPTIKSQHGSFFVVAPAKLSANNRPLVLNSKGQEIELAGVVRNASGNIQFMSTNGQTIAGARLQLDPRAATLLKLTTQQLAQQAPPKFAYKISQSLVTGASSAAGSESVFVLPSGAVIPVEPGDADGNVQLTQAGSLIYYGEEVNDVYAYFVSLINPTVNPGPAATFPTTSAALAPITAFASANGHTFLNPEALTMEIKTAWVDASTLPNPSDYITMAATVPTYDKTTNPQMWTQTGTSTITVALIAMHVVGSAAGHPEMIWSTFEHVGNTPNVGYTYINTSGAQQPQRADPIGGGASWLFTGATPPTLPLTAGAIVSSSTTISSTTAGPVAGTSVLRLAPWGAPNNQTPNPLVASVAASNTQIVSINNDVRSQMNPSDVRNQYLFMGATWTEGGAPPTFNFPQGNIVGTSHLANSTLETFTQSAVFVPGNFPGPGCFACHNTNTTDVSHIFGITRSLF